MPDLNEKIHGILCQHLSALHARSLLSRAMTSAEISVHSRLQQDQLPQLVQRIGRLAGVFLSSERQEELMADLRALCTPQSFPPERIAVKEENDIVVARSRARDLCSMMGGRKFSAQKVATVVSELARNISLYTPGGTIELVPRRDPPRILVRAVDKGTGIPNLDEVMSGGYRSKTGLGCGLLGTKRVASSFHIKTGADGTEIEAEIML
jgi:serine/threonine-protein kinase RsbT